VALAACFVFYRPFQLKWGATRDEVRRPLPGDEIVAAPKFDATRAVTIAAPPEKIWPWLQQIGMQRAGWYSYDLIDNLARRSAEKILPQFQHLHAGDLIPMSPDGRMGFRVKELNPPQWMLWWDERGNLSWVWALVPLDPGHTRLLTRVRLTYRWVSPYLLFYLALDVGDLVMMRQSMLGIRDRAEGRKAGSMLVLSLEFLMWILALAGFVVAEIRMVRKPGFWWPLAVAVFSAAITILLVLGKPPLWVTVLFTLVIWGMLGLVSQIRFKATKKIQA